MFSETCFERVIRVLCTLFCRNMFWLSLVSANERIMWLLSRHYQDGEENGCFGSHRFNKYWYPSDRYIYVGCKVLRVRIGIGTWSRSLWLWSVSTSRLRQGSNAQVCNVAWCKLEKIVLRLLMFSLSLSLSLLFFTLWKNLAAYACVYAGMYFIMWGNCKRIAKFQN